MVTCPVCNESIDVEEEEVDEGETLSCDECGASLTVLGKDPLELEPVDEVDKEEDEDEDDADDEEEEEDEEEEADEWK